MTKKGATIQFNYKKHDPLPKAKQISFSFTGIYFRDVASWLSINKNNGRLVTVSLNKTVNSLGPGSHKTTFSMWQRGGEFAPGEKVATFTVELFLDDGKQSLFPLFVNFSFIVSNKTPDNQTINIVSERAWTVAKNQFWISLSSTSGYGTGSFQIGVIPQGLSVGRYTGAVTVTIGFWEKDIPVSLIVSEQTTIDEFLFVNPKSLFFGYVLSGNLPGKQTIGVHASRPFEVLTSKSWLRTSIVSGEAKTRAIDLFLDKTVVNLTEGTYSASVQIKLKNIIHTVRVFLDVYKFIETSPLSGKIYYAKDDNNIEVSSSLFNSFFYVLAKTVYNSLTLNAKFAIPFFQGRAKKRIGDFAERVFTPSDFQFFKTPTVYVPYVPVWVDYDTKEKEIDIDKASLQSTIPNIGFLKGNDPSPSLVHSKIPKTLFLTKNGVVSFGVRGDAPLTIDVTGNVEEKISVSVNHNEIFNLHFPLSFLKSIKKGDKIRVSAGDIGVDVVVRESGINHSLIFWENQWGCWDCFECTGAFSHSKTYKQITSKTAVSHELIKTNVHDVKRSTFFKVNTGFILSQEEMYYLEDMLNSKNIVLINNHEVYQVWSTTKKLKVSDSERNLNSFDLSFELTEE